MKRKLTALLVATITCLVAPAAAADSPLPHPGRIQVSVVNADLAAIAARVGGDDVQVNVLFRGCILRPGLEVEAAALQSMLRADALVWSGLFHESAAIHHSLEKLSPSQRERLHRPVWIDASLGTKRVNVPTTSCEGFVPIQFMHGDPFWWLNPNNGAVVARNLATRFGEFRPNRAKAYRDNAESFVAELAGHMKRWRRQLATLAGMKVLVTQCGWANVSFPGGPAFLSCRSEPGALPRPEVLAEQVVAQEIPIVVVDPHTPPEYGEVFRSTTAAVVVVIPSSIEEIPGAREYHTLFDNLVQRLLEAATAGAARKGGDHG